MRVLVACEFSGAVREAFRELGHDAYSCDLLPAEDGSRFHIVGDVRNVLRMNLTDLSTILRGGLPEAEPFWDLAICFPPCTYLAGSGLHWNKRIPGRAEKTEEALDFVRELLEAPIPRIALENPVGCISSRIRPPDQIIQPYQFGHDASKKTCLWLKNLPPLTPTEYVPPKYACRCGYRFEEKLGPLGCPDCCGESGPARLVWGNQTPSGQNRLGPSPDRWKERSRTFSGIARAMAETWGREESRTPISGTLRGFAPADDPSLLPPPTYRPEVEE